MNSALKRRLQDPQATHYEVLGVSPGDCERETLQVARRVLAFEVHPDHATDKDRGTAHDLMARVNTAYTVLSNGAARVRYDASLRTSHAECPACEGRGVREVQRGFKERKLLRCMGCTGAGWVRKEQQARRVR